MGIELVTPFKGAVDYRGRPASRTATGGWAASLFLIGTAIAERCAYTGVGSNLITYLTGPLGEPTAVAAAAVNAWNGSGSIIPLIWAFVADSYVGRYRTIVIASLLYLVGFAMLTLSAMQPTLYPPKCSGTKDPTACPPTHFQVAMFYFSLYLVAIGQGGHKSCIQAFGADQFDENDAEECRAKSSFFNWWFFSLFTGSTATTFIVSYIQDNISWPLSFAMLCVFVGVSIILFLSGTRTYRYYEVEDKGTFASAWKACIKLISSWRTPSHARPNDEERDSLLFHHAADRPKFSHANNVGEEGEIKVLLRLLPIWASCLIYATVLPQSSTFFVEQGSTLDRRIGASYQLPPATVQAFIAISIMVFVPIYDRVFVPLARKFTRIHSGITMLQRVGIGIVLMAISMAVAALVEMKRLKLVKDLGLVDLPKATTPMSVWWLFPLYITFGIANVFTMVGLQEFFYDQVPDALRSLGLALLTSIFGIGEFMSSLLVSVIDDVTRRRGESWFSDNLNRAHLDYFYWLLAGLCAVELIIYLYFARSYVYKKKAIAV